MRAQLIIAAAGMGRRLGLNKPKALSPMAGKPLVAATVGRMRAAPFVRPIIIIYPDGWEQAFREALHEYSDAIVLVAGGAERQISVLHGLDALDAATEIAAIHDVARPFVPIEAVVSALDAAREYGGATLATPVSDTILLDNGDGFLDQTPDRSRLWACQTPQVFRTDIIRRAHAVAADEGLVFTDDATLARYIGCTVKLVDGGPMNFKITTSRDLAFAACLWERETP